MNLLPRLASHRTLLRLHVPVAVLVALLQRTPVLRAIFSADPASLVSPAGAVLRSATVAAASLGAMHSLAGATVLAASQASASATVGTAITNIAFTVTNTINIGSWRIGGTIPPGLTVAATQGGTPLSAPGLLDATTPGVDDGYGGSTGGVSTTTAFLRGTPTTAGTYVMTLQAFEFGMGGGRASSTFNYTITVTAAASASPPTVTTQPSSQSAAAGAAVTLSAAASGNPTYQWSRNGNAIAGATAGTLNLSNVQPATAGIYTASVTNSGGAVTSTPAIVGVTSTAKVIGTGSEIAANIVHANGNTFDQVLIDGAALSLTADPGQILRTSLLDMNDDIIQIEFSGAGTVTVVVDGITGPAAPIKYNQAVTYMKGNVGIIVTGADETTNMSVFSVGRANAVNQALFQDGTTYDGFADIAYIAISSRNGKFGGLRTANTSYFATKGYTGVYAPGVEFTGPVFVSNINAFDSAVPVLILGSATDVRITGGDLAQTNNAPIQVSGFTQLRMADGSNSHGTLFPAKTNKGVLQQNGTNVTSQIVLNPGS